MPPHSISHDPDPATPPGLTLDRFRLFPFRSPLLRESLLLSSPRGTQMFQFPRFPLPVLCVQTGVTPRYGCRVSPFGRPRIEAWSAAPRGLSQPPTSFIGFRRQGIHRWLFVAWRIQMLVLAMEFSKVMRTRRRRSLGAEQEQPDDPPSACLGDSPRRARGVQPKAGCADSRLVSDRLGVLDRSMRDARIGRPRLLRKEVIQPHLPVRLPCYDLTPITDPTFDGSLHKWLGDRLRVLPTFVV